MAERGEVSRFGAATQSHQPTAEAVRRAGLAGSVGTALEYYDFVIYSTGAAIVFNKLFFPNVSPTVGFLASMATFAVGFLARPLGGIIFGRLGDRHGRKFVLVTTLLVMGAATTCIGLIPTYSTIGIASPLLLVVLRFIQGLGAGAEQESSATLLVETAPAGKRGRMASLVIVGSSAGVALGSIAWILVQLMGTPAVLAGGWRIVFLSSLVIIVAALIVRSRMQDSPVFRELTAAGRRPRAPLSDVLKHGMRPVLLVVGMNIGAQAGSYTYSAFMGGYAVTVIGVDESLIPKILLAGGLAGILLGYLAGVASDRFGRRPPLLVMSAFLLCYPIPAFLLLQTGSPVIVSVVIWAGYVIAAIALVAAQFSLLSELFGSRYRNTGLSMSREVSSIFGGIAPVVAASLLAAFSNSWVPVAAFMMLMVAVMLVVTWIAPETRNRDLLTTEDASHGETAGLL